MAVQISVENLSPVTYNQIPVITTELLAHLYGTEAIRIRQNTTKTKVVSLRKNTSSNLKVKLYVSSSTE